MCFRSSEGILIDIRPKKLTRRLRAKRIALVRTQVVDLDHNLVRAGGIGCQSPADTAGSGRAGASAAAVDGLGDGGVVARVAVPAAGLGHVAAPV